MRVTANFLRRKYGVAPSTISNIEKRATGPLIRHYKAQPRQKSAAHLSLTYHGIETQDGHLVNRAEHQDAHNTIYTALYLPVLERIAQDTHVAAFLEPANGMEQLVHDALTLTPTTVLHPLFMQHLYCAYRQKRISLSAVRQSTEKDVLTRIKYGGLAIAGEKEERLKAAIAMLSERQQYVLTRRYMNGRVQQFHQLARELSITVEGARKIEVAALRNLRGQLGELLFGLPIPGELRQTQPVRAENGDRVQRQVPT